MKIASWNGAGSCDSRAYVLESINGRTEWQPLRMGASKIERLYGMWLLLPWLCGSSCCCCCPRAVQRTALPHASSLRSLLAPPDARTRTLPFDFLCYSVPLLPLTKPRAIKLRQSASAIGNRACNVTPLTDDVKHGVLRQ